MSTLKLRAATKPLSATVSVPGSKSLTNRALVAGALANGTSILSNALFADDTRRMIDVLGALGFAIATDPRGGRIEITGAGGHVPAGEAQCFCGNSGTTIRFCTALAALGRGCYVLDGVPRMRQRPIGPLVGALGSLGASISFDENEGYPPITLRSKGLSAGTVVLDTSVSSQFLSALLLAAPSASGDVMIDVRGKLSSAPYVAMTTNLMAAFGVSVAEDVGPDGAKYIVPAPQAYRAEHYTIEPDASNASYFLAAAAVAGGTVTVDGLGTSSIQGDVHFVDVLEQMGCHVDRGANRLTVTGRSDGRRLHGIDIDLNAMPDMVQTTAVLALFADGPTSIRNVPNLRVKETDRLSALARELTAAGAQVEERADGLTITPPGQPRAAAIKTYDDHRMAMSFSLLGLAVDGVTIQDAECVDKTFPGFFKTWSSLCR